MNDLPIAFPDKTHDALKKMIQRFVKNNQVRKAATQNKEAIYEKTVA